MSINPYLLKIITIDSPDGYSYDGHEEVSIDTTIASKLGSSNVGSEYVPIYLNLGVATACSSPSLLVNLESTTAASIFAATPRPGVTGVLPVANGGTGSTNADDAWLALGGGVRSIATGNTNGTINVNTNGTTSEVAVKGLGTAAYKAEGYFALASHGYHVPTPQTANNKIFLRNDNTWQTITPANIGAAAASHGNHVPAIQTANNAIFLRNDNTWQTITPANIGAATSGHTHTSFPSLSITNSTASTSTGTGALIVTGGVGVGGNLYASKVYNAIWNDYAEMRKTNFEVKFGQCVIDNDDGSLSIANKRLLPGAQVVSDTWGHIMGETDNAKTPVAVAGRVLVYPYRDRSEYHAGMSVCTAPNGTVDIMTREEIMMYPDCIVGIVSEIPTYEKWGSGNVDIDGRIWIKIK